MSQSNLFGPSPIYPIDAGWKEPASTSAQAAQAIDARTLQGLVLGALRTFGPLTADEIADGLHLDRLSIRPRLSELYALGKVEKTMQTRANASGKAARVWAVRA